MYDSKWEKKIVKIESGKMNKSIKIIRKITNRNYKIIWKAIVHIIVKSHVEKKIKSGKL